MKIYSPLVLLLLLALAGCSSSSRSTSSEGGAMEPPSNLNVAVGAVGDGNAVRFYLAAGAPALSAATNEIDTLATRTVQSVSRFKVILRRADGSPFDSLETNEVVSSGQKNTETKAVSIARTATLEWYKPKSLPAGASATLLVIDNGGRAIVANRVLLDTLGNSSTPARRSIELELQVRSMGGGVEFLVTATRRLPAPEGEYLPSGEKYRIELSTQLGEPIWSNDNGIVYTQDIRQVEPLSVGESVVYRGFWDGTDPRTRKFAPPGRYKVLVTIPARPIPYTLHEEIQLGGDQ